MFWCFIYVGPTLRISSHHIDLWKRFEVCFIAAGVDGNLEPDDPPILLIWFKPAATVLSDIVCGRQVNSAGPDLLSTPAHRGSAQRLGSSFNPPVFCFCCQSTPTSETDKSTVTGSDCCSCTVFLFCPLFPNNKHHHRLCDKEFHLNLYFNKPVFVCFIQVADFIQSTFGARCCCCVTVFIFSKTGSNLRF